MFVCVCVWGGGVSKEVQPFYNYINILAKNVPLYQNILLANVILYTSSACDDYEKQKF